VLRLVLCGKTAGYKSKAYKNDGRGGGGPSP
jgi:hypothetical protein